MQTYELLVRGRAVLPNSDDMTLVRTSIGIDQVHVLFDNAEWLGFALTATFAQGEGDGLVKVTQSLTPSSLEGGEWVAEATCPVPYEVIEMTGPIRVTFQGTDSQGNRIITAAGAPLSVEEAGDVDDGEPPEPAPTVSQWEQAYADAMAAASEARSAAGEVDQAIADMEARGIPIATDSELGGVIVDGETITVDAEGVIRGAQSYTLPPASTDTLGGVTVDGDTIAADSYGGISLVSTLKSAIANLRILAATAFDTTFGQDGYLESATVKPGSLPLATAEEPGAVQLDGVTITADAEGVISSSARRATWRGTCVSSATASEKEVSCDGFAISEGSLLAVTFTNANTRADVISLSVNGANRATIYAHNEVTSSTNPLTWAAGETLTFIFSSNYWRYLARDAEASGGSSGTAIWRGTSTTPYATAEKDVTCSGFELAVGAVVAVYSYNGNRAESPTLNVNSTGAKPIRIRTSSATSLQWVAGDTLTFMYDGTGYSLLARQSASDGPFRGYSSTAADVAEKAVSCYPFSLNKFAIVSVTFAEANSVDAPTLNIDSTGAKPVRVGNAATGSDNPLHWDAGDTLTFMYDTYYVLLARDRVTTPVATASTLGVVKPDGTTITVAADGTITASGGGGGGGYILPTASASQLGGVKVGSGLAVDADGVLSLDLANGDGVSY